MTLLEHMTWATVDKSSWGDGPWQDEPDKEQWADAATGLPCLVKRSPSGGALCGYVGVPEGHPWFRRDWDVIEADVHGGLTYGGPCEEGPEDRTICHVPGPGEPDHVWWLGFDCDHAWDVAPAREARERARGLPPMRFGNESYKTVAYVKAECERLAVQAAALAVPPDPKANLR